MKTTDYAVRRLADELDQSQVGGLVNLPEVASTLRALADRLELLLTIANDLADSMDFVQADRALLAVKVDKLTIERDGYVAKLREMVQLNRAPADHSPRQSRLAWRHQLNGVQ